MRDRGLRRRGAGVVLRRAGRAVLARALPGARRAATLNGWCDCINSTCRSGCSGCAGLL